MHGRELIQKSYVSEKEEEKRKEKKTNLLTIMLKGAAKTLTEKATQTHPRTRTRFGPFTKSWERRRIKQNPPKFIRRRSLNVKICNIPSSNSF
jgi:hypothetical protein